MDLSEDSGALHSTEGGPSFELVRSIANTSSQTESGGAITLLLLQFRTLLYEVVEELQIQRDSKTRFEDQISKLVLEKQELEWEKESLQQQTETAANQHNDALMNMQTQFQAKIRNVEEAKGKYQITAELKDREMNNLKEELKSLQLLKYQLEKKAIELEQKLTLQCRSKDSHINQLGEVEKRFRALLRQCNMVKQAHEKLEQNVDDALKINTKLTSANGRLISTNESLQKELEEVRIKLIKENMSTFKYDKTENLTTTKQYIQQLDLRLNKETEINKKLQEDNLTVRAEKQEVMRSLQYTQQLLLNQTQAMKKVEMELQIQIKQNQALKQEHDMMQEKNKAKENNVVQLMESSIITKTSWDKKEITGKETLNEAISSSDLPALQHSASGQIQTKNCPEDTQAKQDVSGAPEGQNPNHQQQFLMKQPVPSNSSTCQPANNHHVSLSSPHGAAGSLLNKDIENSETAESISDAVSDLLNTSISVSDHGLQISKTVSVSCSGQKSIDVSLDGDKSHKAQERRIEISERFKKDVKSREINRDEYNNRELQCKDTDDVKEGGTVGQKRGLILNQTDEADREEVSLQSAEDTGGSKQSKTIRRSRGEEEDGTYKRDETENTLEKQIGAWINSHPTTGEKPKTDFRHTEPPEAASKPPDCSISLSEKDDKTDVNIHQPGSHSPTSIGVQLSCLDEVQNFAENASLSTNKESRASLSTGLFTVSTSSVTSNRLSCQTPSLCDGAPTLAAGLSFGSSVSTDQPSFRTQISKIEQLQLQLHKRQRKDN